MPTSGGLAIWLGIVLPLAAGQMILATSLIPVPDFVAQHLSGLEHQSGRLWTILAGGTVLMILGLVDDRRGLDWRLRICVQTLVALAMVLSGKQLTLFLDLPILTGALSVVWIVGLVNSFNMLDNMDGLSAGVAAIAASMLAAVMLLAPNPITHQPQLFIGGFLLVVVGALVGFLGHNRPPAQLFMGDAGSYLIGYLLAVASLTGRYASYTEHPYAVLAPLCVLAVPLYDTASVIFIRLRSGRSPFEGDKSHFSHRLVELGMTKPQAVLTIYLTTATCGLGALLLHQVNLAGAFIILVLVGCVLLLVAILETTGRRGRRNGKGAGDGAT
jgi:UDP-GlcNAc:undecaprenyl-phosphate GlcNAc-1-phosphate transferase